MEQFAEYGHAIVAVALTAVLGLVLGPLSALRKLRIGLEPGAQPAADYSSSTYRWTRSYLNLSEVMGFYVAVVVAAILAGANPVWVNWLASLFFMSRLILAVIHIGGFGKPNFSLRTFTFVAGWAMCVLLAVMAICGVMST